MKNGYTTPKAPSEISGCSDAVAQSAPRLLKKRKNNQLTSVSEIFLTFQNINNLAVKLIFVTGRENVVINYNRTCCTNKKDFSTNRLAKLLKEILILGRVLGENQTPTSCVDTLRA